MTVEEAREDFVRLQGEADAARGVWGRAVQEVDTACLEMQKAARLAAAAQTLFISKVLCAGPPNGPATTEEPK